MKLKNKIFMYFIIFNMFTSCTTFYMSLLDFVGNKLLENKDETYESYYKNYNDIPSKLSALNKEYRLEYKKINKVKYIRYLKKDSKNLLLYVHGGAFERKKVHQDHIALMQNIKNGSRVDYEIIFLDYKGDKYPRQTDELEILLNYLEPKYEKIIIIADSSGGNIVLSNTLKRRDENKKMVEGLILLSPWTDTSNRVKSRFKNFNKDVLMGKSMYNKLLLYNPYLKGQNLLDPYVSPVYGEYHNFPKTLIQYGELEILEDDSKIVCSKIKKSGGECEVQSYEGMVHVFQFFKILDKTDLAINNIVDFIERIFNN